MGLGGDLPVIGAVLAAVALLLVAVAAVMLIVPAVVFVVELLFVVAIIGLGVMGRVLFGRPWTVEARQQDAVQTYEWTVIGWRASRDLVRTIAHHLRTAGLPTGGSPVPRPDS